jgi:hypothetical protein
MEDWLAFVLYMDMVASYPRFIFYNSSSRAEANLTFCYSGNGSDMSESQRLATLHMDAYFAECHAIFNWQDMANQEISGQERTNGEVDVHRRLEAYCRVMRGPC